MRSAMEQAAEHYRYAGAAMPRIAVKMSGEAWGRRLEGRSSALWILGHLCIYRRRMLRMLGEAIAEDAWEAAFKKGTQPGEHPAELTAELLVADFVARGEQLAPMLETMSAEQADAPAGFTLPDGSDQVGTTISFFAWHESYHLGQLGLMARISAGE